MTVAIQRHRTAMSRTTLSRPVALAFEDGLISTETSVFDFGCGRGGDLRQLGLLGVTAEGWDPNHRPDAPQSAADLVNLGYVINVIEDQRERRAALQDAWRLARTALIVAARPAWEARDVRGRAHADGVITSKDTFQKFYEQDELRAFIESTITGRAVAAAPGIFYVFREDRDAQAFLARRVRRPGGPGRRITELLYEHHREVLKALEAFVDVQRRLPAPGELDDTTEAELVTELGSVRAAFSLLRRVHTDGRWADVDTGRTSQSERKFEAARGALEPLMTFMDERGRLPQPDEIDSGADLVSRFGSVRSAFSLVRRVVGAERWALAEERARTNFLVYLALAAFGGRPRFGELPDDLQLDVRELFGNYSRAVGQADELLFSTGDPRRLDQAVRAATVGKVTPEALYVHVSALDDLPPVLRVYEGCGRALSGTVDDATIVKLHRQKAQVSYLAYPTFDRDAHPALQAVVISRLGKLRLTYRDFRESANPPILHRKETFVGPDYPGREKFLRLSEQEERLDLLSSATIGTRTGWQERLTEVGVQVKGHRVVKQR
jgi:hypothetical protein